MLKKIKKMYPHQTLMMFFILGLMTIAGSFIVEHVFNVRPCEMCLWQRYLAVAITVVAFIGTLFRGKIKKVFIGTITLIALASLTIGVWQSLSQYDSERFPLPPICSAPAVETVTLDSTNLLTDLKTDNTGYVDCSKPEDFFVYNYTGITLANINVVLMLFVAVFSFYKLFFKPRKRFRKYNNNNRRNYRNKGNKQQNNGNRRYRGSGYNRANNRNNRRSHGQNNYNDNKRNNSEN